MVAAVLGGLFILGAALPIGTAAASTASQAAVPEAPVPGYTPAFVTQTDQRPPWDDCLWASGAMLLDKWTNGRIQPDRERLRRASGDLVGGSTFSDLVRAVARVYGWRPAFSPNGGDPLTWAGLLKRLAAGGGAVIAGRYGNLGYPYTRWDLSYAADPNASGHAVYVERYDAAHGRLWLMDPLGRGSYDGEWISVARVRHFIWLRGGFVAAMATPAPPSHSATGWVPGSLAIAPGSHRAGDVVAVTLPLVKAGPWPLPAMSLQATWQSIEADPSSSRALTTRAALVLVSAQPSSDGSPPTGATVAPGSLQAILSFPAAPGLWRFAPTLVRADGKSLPPTWQLAPAEIRVWGDRGALVTPLTPSAASAAGQALQVTVTVEDAGRLPWTLDNGGPQLGEDGVAASTELEADWVSADGQAKPALPPVTLVGASGEQWTMTLQLVAPPLPGDYVLQFDVRDGQGSLLAPEDTTAGLPLTVGPAPLPLPPASNL